MVLKVDVFQTPEGYIAVMSLKLSKPLNEVPKNLLDGFKVVLIKSASVASSRHAAIAAYRALRAFREEKNITRNLESEVAVCLTGERQIHKALKRTNPIGTDRVISIVISAQPKDWNVISTKVCERLKATEINEFGSLKELVKEFGVENLLSCSERLELIILEKSALVELER